MSDSDPTAMVIPIPGSTTALLKNLRLCLKIKDMLKEEGLCPMQALSVMAYFCGMVIASKKPREDGPIIGGIAVMIATYVELIDGIEKEALKASKNGLN